MNDGPHLHDYLHHDEIAWPWSWRPPGEEYLGPFSCVLEAEGRRLAGALREKRRAEERDRREWLADVECRLGLVVAGRSPHRGIVRRMESGGWSWRCRRLSCWQFAWNYPSQAGALADAHAHAVTGDPARYRFTW